MSVIPELTHEAIADRCREFGVMPTWGWYQPHDRRLVIGSVMGEIVVEDKDLLSDRDWRLGFDRAMKRWIDTPMKVL